jgi:hypothetical protein
VLASVFICAVVVKTGRKSGGGGMMLFCVTANRSSENLAQFRYLKTIVTNQNLIQEEIKWRLNSGNACYHSVQNLLPFPLLSKNVKIRIYKIIILLVVLYNCETWSRTLREEHRLRAFETEER